MLSAVRTCTDCQLTEPLEAFTPIRGTSRYYGRCKACRARRAWEQVHLGCQYVGRRSEQSAVRTCTDCSLVKATAEFTPIKACKQGWYGRCRDCRAKRARERYQADPLERELQKARVRRNRERRRAAARA